MSAEIAQGAMAFIAVLFAACYAFLQMLGGRANKTLGISARVWGRIIAPFFLSLGMIGLSLAVHHFKWWNLLCAPVYFLAVNIGYGGDKLWVKILRRLLWAIIKLCGALPFVLFSHAWIIFGVQVFLCVTAAEAFGVTSILIAPKEEFIINFCSVLFTPFMV